MHLRPVWTTENVRFARLLASGRGRIREFFSAPRVLAEIPGVFKCFLENQPETIDRENCRNVRLFKILRPDSIIAVGGNDRCSVGHWPIASCVRDTFCGGMRGPRRRCGRTMWPRSPRKTALMSICSSSCIAPRLRLHAATIAGRWHRRNLRGSRSSLARGPRARRTHRSLRPLWIIVQLWVNVEVGKWAGPATPRTPRLLQHRSRRS